MYTCDLVLERIVGNPSIYSDSVGKLCFTETPLAALCHEAAKVNVRQLSEPSQQRMKNTGGHEAQKQRVSGTLH